LETVHGIAEAWETTQASPGTLTALAPSPRPSAEREREELRAQVFHLERLAQAGVLAGGLAHDTRNLLAAISGTCQLAVLDDRTSPVHAFEQVQHIAERAARAMEVFLAFVRRGGGSASTCRLEDVVTDAVRFLGPVLGKSRVTLHRRVEQGLRVRCEATLLLQALVNLVSNAFRAVDSAAGRVEIVAARDGDQITVDVRDDGPGVPDAVRDRLFQPFVTSCASRGGTGLGLHVSRQILEQHGGSLVLVESRPGCTVFRMRLPALPASTSPTRHDVPVSETAR
jgi:signal transduction histidine kinase